MRMLSYRIWLVVLLAALAFALLSSCDYPEQGAYALIARNAMDEEAWREPFLVEELTDDSHMTVGFTLLLPRDGALVELPLTNVPDYTRRAWLLALADADSAAGDLRLELAHEAERLSFTGAYRLPEAETGYPLAGFLVPGGNPDVGRMVLNGDPPPLAEAAMFEIAAISMEQFEQALGLAVNQAERIAAQPLAEFAVKAAPPPETLEDDVVEEEPAAEPEEEEEEQPKRPPKGESPPLGGRTGKRPR